MSRLTLHAICIGLLFYFGLVTSQAQTLSSCGASPPMPAKVKPGVGALSLSRDGKTLVVAGGDSKIRFVDMQTGEVQRTFTGHTNALYRAIYSPDEKLIGSSSRDTTARIWDAATGQELLKLGGFRCAVKALDFSPNGKILAASGNDGMLKLWDVKTGTELKSLIHINTADIDMSIYTFAFGRDGKKIYAGNGDGTISEWDVASGKETRVWKAHDGNVLRVLFSPDYKFMASLANSDLKLWSTATWSELRSLPMPHIEGVNPYASAIVFSHDGKLIAASGVGIEPKQNTYAYVQTLVWDVKTGQKLFTLQEQKFDINGLVFSLDDRFLLTGSVDTTIKFWDMKTGQAVRTFTMTLR